MLAIFIAQAMFTLLVSSLFDSHQSTFGFHVFHAAFIMISGLCEDISLSKSDLFLISILEAMIIYFQLK